jgi:glutathione synthase
MQHIFITDSFESLVPNHDSSLALMREACKLGDEVFQAEQEQIYFDKGSVFISACLVQSVTEGNLKINPEKKSFNISSQYEDLVVWMRKDPPVDEAYIRTCQLLASSKARVLNNPNSLLVCNEKILPLEFTELIPETLITSDLLQIKSLLASKKKLVAKPIAGKAGEGILILNEGDKNVSSILELMILRGSTGGKNKIIVQEFLPEIVDGDRRIFLLAGDPIGAVNRLANKDDNRANMAAGGRVEPHKLSKRELEICQILKPRLLDLGLIVVGLDVIGGKVTEINITSPTCLEEINQFDKSNPAKQIVEWAKK